MLPPECAPEVTPSGVIRRPRVGVFDSGIGGLSVLPALKAELPQAAVLYAADSAHAPYGERSPAWLTQRCMEVAGFLRRQGADLLIMACNTATAVAAPALRAAFPDWPIVGIEPGLKPAARLSRSGRVGVLATQATLRSSRYAQLLAEHGRDVQVVARECVGLAWAIEVGDTAQTAQLIQQHTQDLRDQRVDVVVLGCTHYPFARDLIQSAMGPHVQLIDTAEAVARRAAWVWMQTQTQAQDLQWPQSSDAFTHQANGPDCADDPLNADRYWTSGDPLALQAFAQRALAWTIKAQALDAGEAEPATAGPDR